MNPIDILKYGHLTVMNTLGNFPREAWYTGGACGYWSVKDLVSHLASFELALVEALESCLHPGPTPLLKKLAANGQEFNDEQVDRLRKDKTMEEVLAEYTTANQLAMVAAAHISPQVWDQEGIFPWYGKEYDLEDYIVYAFYGHKREHCGQIMVFRDRL